MGTFLKVVGIIGMVMGIVIIVLSLFWSGGISRTLQSYSLPSPGEEDFPSQPQFPVSPLGGLSFLGGIGGILGGFGIIVSGVSIFCLGSIYNDVKALRKP